MDKFVIPVRQHGALGSSFLILACVVGTVGGTIACLERSGGHAPSAAHQPPDVALQSLQMLVSDGVYALQKMAAPPRRRAGTEEREGTSVARLLAKILDARFDGSGWLLELHVAAPGLDCVGEPVRVLPASVVSWDDSRRQWFVTEPGLRFADLAAVPDAESALQPSVLASQLLRAEVAPPACDSSTGDLAPALGPAAAQLPVVWIAPAAQRLAFVVVSVLVPADDSGEVTTTRHVPVPWSLVRARPRDDTAVIELAAEADAPATAPTCIDARECPWGGLRQRTYEHFGIAPPAWDEPFEIVARARNGRR